MKKNTCADKVASPRSRSRLSVIGGARRCLAATESTGRIEGVVGPLLVVADELFVGSGRLICWGFR